MIQVYDFQKELHEASLDFKTLERIFANLITGGSNFFPYLFQAWQHKRNDHKKIATDTKREKGSCF